MNRPLYYLLFLAGLGLSQTGCMLRPAGIDNRMDQQLANDRDDVNATQHDYQASVLESGLSSGETKTAVNNMDNAEHKLEIDKRQFDDYRSASGQSSVPRNLATP